MLNASEIYRARKAALTDPKPSTTYRDSVERQLAAACRPVPNPVPRRPLAASPKPAVMPKPGPVLVFSEGEPAWFRPIAGPLLHLR